MIKKNTTLVINWKQEKLKGGMPLCKGDKVKFDGKELVVANKRTDIVRNDEDLIVYVLEWKRNLSL